MFLCPLHSLERTTAFRDLLSISFRLVNGTRMLKSGNYTTFLLSLIVSRSAPIGHYDLLSCWTRNSMLSIKQGPCPCRKNWTLNVRVLEGSFPDLNHLYHSPSLVAVLSVISEAKKNGSSVPMASYTVGRMSLLVDFTASRTQSSL